MKRPVIDAEFEIVSGIRERKPWYVRLGYVLGRVALQTVFATLAAGVAAVILIYGFGATDRTLAFFRAPVMILGLWLCSITVDWAIRRLRRRA